MTHTHKLYLS